MMPYGVIPREGDEGSVWLRKVVVQGYPDAFLAMGGRLVEAVVLGYCPQGQEEAVHNAAKTYLKDSAVEHSSADAQYLLGMLDCFLHGCARSKPEMLKTARWFRLAAHQRLAEAQWELGEWFLRGVFCDVHMPFARKYIRRASKQGHAAALARMAELRRCVHCGADDDARKGKLCLEARYCDAACAARHWREGGGCLGGYDAPHKTACPRTHAADGASSDSGDDDGE
jgi:TPR repeat protein